MATRYGTVMTEGGGSMKKKVLTTCACLFFLCIAASNVCAFTVFLTDFEGRPGTAFAEITGEGTTSITFNLGLINTIADIRGFFFDVDGGVSNLLIFGPDVTGFDASGNVTDLGGGNNVNGTGLSFDVGVEIGTSGIGSDDISSTSFVLTNDNPLMLGQIFAMRLMSAGDDREDSLKMVGLRSVVPEPSVLVLLGAGMLSVFCFRKK